MKTIPKNRYLLPIVLISLLFITAHRLFFKNDEPQKNNYTLTQTPFTKEEQEALIAAQEQGDEKRDLGPMTEKITAAQAQAMVLNLHPTGNKTAQS